MRNRGWRSALLPAGAVAGRRSSHGSPYGSRRLRAMPFRARPSDLEILLGEEDLEMLDEELEFYGWLEEQPEFAVRTTVSVDAQDQCRGAGARLFVAFGRRAQEADPDAPEPGPDLDFLEYLGAWAEDDDEWLAIEEWQKDHRCRCERGRRGVRE